MKSWTLEPYLSNDRTVWLSRIGEISFFAANIGYINTFLDDRCSCIPKKQCEFHANDALFSRDETGARTGLKNATSR